MYRRVAWLRRQGRYHVAVQYKLVITDSFHADLAFERTIFMMSNRSHWFWAKSNNLYIAFVWTILMRAKWSQNCLFCFLFGFFSLCHSPRHSAILPFSLSRMQASVLSKCVTEVRMCGCCRLLYTGIEPGKLCAAKTSSNPGGKLKWPQEPWDGEGSPSGGLRAKA
jgi:hypothetical protein